MNFDELNEMIPYAKGGKEKILRMNPYPNIILALPGRHQNDTVPVGGDFVVMVTDPLFNTAEHQFTHTDIFKDVETRLWSSSSYDRDICKMYLAVIQGADPDDIDCQEEWKLSSQINRKTFLHAVQCLAVAEHRRYAKYEKQFGGRYLPFRFAAGINEMLWSAADAANLQKKGRPGVEMLEKQNGTPTLTKELMNG